MEELVNGMDKRTPVVRVTDCAERIPDRPPV